MSQDELFVVVVSSRVVVLVGVGFEEKLEFISHFEI